MRSDRRKLLKALALSGGAVTITKLPASWSKPVIESVVLPAHADLSPGETCVIQLDVALGLTGNYEGVWEAVLYDLSTCYLNEEVNSPTEETFSFPQLGPGTYFFFGGGAVTGSEGAGAFRMEVSCCNESEVAEAQAAGIGSDDDRLDLVITIGDDGTCSISSEPTPLPPPCFM